MEYLNDSNFDNFIKENNNVVVDFFADWCGPCKMLSPIIEELSESYKDKGLKIVKVNVDEASTIAQKFDIMSIPTIIFFQDGKIKDTIIGLVTKEVFENKIRDLIK
ncbi:MAG: thioredoxin [Patescibacteria group bacterium]|nr:thioredoxin [Patescibacteria group bacterium]